MSEPVQPQSQAPEGQSLEGPSLDDVPQEAWSGVHRGPLRAGEWVRLVDGKGRKHNFALEAGKRFFSNRGHLDHDELIGRGEGLSLIHI